MSELRRILRRSQRARYRHLSHVPIWSAASAPHTHIGPLRHPFNLRPTLITSCQRSLAFRKVRSAKNAASPDTIGSREHRVPFRAAPRHIPLGQGQPGLYSILCSRLSCRLCPGCLHHFPFPAAASTVSGLARPAPNPLRHGPGVFSSMESSRAPTRYPERASESQHFLRRLPGACNGGGRTCRESGSLPRYSPLS